MNRGQPGEPGGSGQEGQPAGVGGEGGKGGAGGAGGAEGRGGSGGAGGAGGPGATGRTSNFRNGLRTPYTWFDRGCIAFVAGAGAVAGISSGDVLPVSAIAVGIALGTLVIARRR